MADPSPGLAGTEQDDSKQPTTTLDRDALLVRFQRWFKEDRPHCEKWHKIAEEDYKFAALDQWNAEDKKRLEEQQRVPLTFDRTGVIIDSVTGAEVANRQEVRYIPRTTGDAIKDEMLTEGARWFRDQCNAEHEESHAFRDTCISGMGWTETRLDYEENPDGDPKIERTDPLCMYWDHAARKPNLTDARRIWRLFDKMPIEEARAKFDGVDDDDLDAGWARGGTADSAEPYDASRPRYRTEKPMGDGEDDGAEAVTILEVQWTEREPFYRATITAPPPVDPMTGGPALDPTTGQPAQPNVQRVELSEEEHQNMQGRVQQLGIGYQALRQIRKVHYRAFVGNVVLEFGKLFAPPGDSNYQPKSVCRRFGYNCITGKLDRNAGHWFGLMRAMKDPQRFTNKWLSQALHILNTTAKGGIMAEGGAFEDDVEAEENWAKPDAITKLKPGGLQKIKEKPVQGFPQQIMQLTEFAISSIRDATGVNAEVLGLRSADQAASLEYQRRQAATTILAPLFDSLKLYRRLQGEVLLYLIVNYLADGRLIRITGDDEKGQYTAFQIPPDFTTYDVIVDDAPSSPNQKEAMWQTVTQLFPVLKSLPIPPAALLKFLDASPLPASFVAEFKAEIQKGMQEAQANPPPNPGQIKQQELEAELQAKQKGHELDLQHHAQKNELDLQSRMKQKQVELATRPMNIGPDGQPMEEQDPLVPQVQQLAAQQGQIMQMLQALAQGHQASSAQVLQGLNQLGAIMSAPTRVVRDEFNRVSGAEKVFQQPTAQ